MPARAWWSATWPSWSRAVSRDAAGEDRAPHGSRTVPGRPVATGGDDLPFRRPRDDGDSVQRRQRLPGDAWQPRGGSRRDRPRHVHKRFPRDLADPARGGGFRVRPHRPDDRQRPRRQADEAVRRRRTVDPRHLRARELRAVPRLPRRRPATQPGVAYAGRQAGPRRVDPDGLDDAAAPGGPHPRGDHAHGRRADRDLLAAAEPPGRQGRVLRALRSDGRGHRPTQGGRVRRAGAAPPRPLRPRRPHAPGLPVRAVAHDDRGGRRPPPRDDRRDRDDPQRRRGPRQDGLPHRGARGQQGPAGEAGDLPHLPRRPCA